MTKVKRQLGTILLLLMGLYFLLGSLLGLDLGTARRMGPGFFPMGVGAILCLLTVIDLFTSRSDDSEPDKPDYGSVAAVVAGIVAFAFGVPLLGVMPAAFLSVIFTSFADLNLAMKSRISLGLLVSLGVWLVFVVGLKLPFTAIKGLG